MPIYTTKHPQGTMTNIFASITHLTGTHITLRPTNFSQVSLVVLITARLALVQILCLLVLICQQLRTVFSLEILRILTKLFRNGGAWDGWGGKKSNSQGLVYTTAAALKSAKQALAAAELKAEVSMATMAASGRPQLSTSNIDLSWPTMLCAPCKKKAQHGLYNASIVDVPCTCLACVAGPPTTINLDSPCNCSGCVTENIPTPTKPIQPSTILSTIPPIDQISSVARAYGETALKQFRKDIWRADSDNCILGPEIYMPDNLIKEVLDQWLRLDSLSTFSRFLAPYP